MVASAVEEQTRVRWLVAAVETVQQEQRLAEVSLIREKRKNQADLLKDR